MAQIGPLRAAAAPRQRPGTKHGCSASNGAACWRVKSGSHKKKR